MGFPAERESNSLLGEFVYRMGIFLKQVKLTSQQLTISEVINESYCPKKKTFFSSNSLTLL